MVLGIGSEGIRLEEKMLNGRGIDAMVQEMAKQ